MKEYKKRVADQILSDRLESSGTVLISSVSCFRPSDSSLDGEISIRIMLFFNGRHWRFSYRGDRCMRP